MAKMWSAGETTGRPEPVSKPVDPLLSAVTLNLAEGDLETYKKLRHTSKQGTPEETTEAMLRSGLPKIFTRVSEQIFRDANSDTTLKEWAIKHDNEHVGLFEDAYNLEIPFELEKFNSPEELSKLQTAIYTFLTKQGIQLLPPPDATKEFFQNKRFVEESTPGTEPWLELQLDPNQKISELGPKGQKLFDALVALSNAAHQAYERGSIKRS